MRSPKITMAPIVAAALLMLSACASVTENRPVLQSSATSAANPSDVIKVESVRLSAGGLMLDVRYRVVGDEKATVLFNRKTPLTLTDQATGTILTVPATPKVGKLRQLPQNVESSRVYWMFFNNPGGLVKRGEKVALSVGDLRIDDLVVE